MNSAYEREKKQYVRLRTAQRMMTYIVRTLMLLIAVILICVLAFLTAERMSNLYILSTEGMALRAEAILGDATEKELEEYFLLTWLSEDTALAGEAYRGYEVAGYNYNLEIEKISVMPWSSTATVTAVESATVKGSINSDRIEEGKTSSDYPMPAWGSARYRIHYVFDGERWYISDLETVDTNPQVAPLRTPDLSQSVRPMATPTPTVAPVPLG